MLSQPHKAGQCRKGKKNKVMKIKTTYRELDPEGTIQVKTMYRIDDDEYEFSRFYDDDGSPVFMNGEGNHIDKVLPLYSLAQPFEDGGFSLQPFIKEMSEEDEVWIASYKLRKSVEDHLQNIQRFRENPYTLVVTEEQFQLILTLHSSVIDEEVVYSFNGDDWFRVKVLS